MTIKRVKTHSKNFTILNNSPLYDPNTSCKAKGLWSQIMSLPDDWNINARYLMKINKDGYESILSGLNELVEKGYAKKEQNKNEKGHFMSGGWTVYEDKQQELKECLPQSGNPIADDRRSDNAQLLSTELPSTELPSIKREREPAPSSSEKIERAKNVSTSDKDHQKLIDAHGEELTQTFYKMLSDWKDITPKSKWKLGDYKSILRWVIDKHQELERKNKTGSKYLKPITAAEIKRNRSNAYHAREIIKSEGKFLLEDDGIRVIETKELIMYDNPDYYNIKQELRIY